MQSEPYGGQWVVSYLWGNRFCAEAQANPNDPPLHVAYGRTRTEAIEEIKRRLDAKAQDRTPRLRPDAQPK